MMRNTLGLILLTLMIACEQKDRDISIQVKNNIKLVLLQQQNDWNNGDIESFMKGYWKSDSLSFIGSGGINFGWENTLAAYKSKYPDKASMGLLTFDILKTEIINPFSAIQTGKFILDRNSGQMSGYFTLFWKKIHQKWVIVADHTCG